MTEQFYQNERERRGEVHTSNPGRAAASSTGSDRSRTFDNNRNDILALNDVGQAAGVSLNPETGPIEAFLQENEQRTSLGTFGGSHSLARGINNRGEKVGGSPTTGDENFHGFVYRKNQLYDLNARLEPARDGN